MARNFVRCDVCGILGQIEMYGSGFYEPNGWQDTNVGDLCPACLKLWEEAKRNFLKKHKK